jgi:hypothetical protein
MFGFRRTVAYKVGDVIEQACFGMMDCKRIVIVTERESDVKNGRPGFSGRLCDEQGQEICQDDRIGNGVWGYDTDVVRVVRPA